MTDPSKPSTRRTCAGHKGDGSPCGNRPAKGANVCGFHGAKAPQVAKRAIVRAEIEAWGLTDQTIDPGIVLLRLVAQSARRAERYALLLEADFEAKDVAALIGSAYSEAGKTGEYIRGLAALEAQERDRCANFAAKAVTAGVAERQVRLAEELGGQIIAVLRGTLVALGMDPDEPAVREAVGAQLRALPAG